LTGANLSCFLLLFSVIVTYNTNGLSVRQRYYTPRTSKKQARTAPSLVCVLSAWYQPWAGRSAHEKTQEVCSTNRAGSRGKAARSILHDFFLFGIVFSHVPPGPSLSLHQPNHSQSPRNPARQIGQGNRRDISAKICFDATPRVAKIETIVSLSNLTCGTSPHPRRRLPCYPPNTLLHDAPHRKPRARTPRATGKDTASQGTPHSHTVETRDAPHCRPRARTPQAMGKDTASHGQGHRKPRARTPQARERHTATLSKRTAKDRPEMGTEAR